MMLLKSAGTVTCLAGIVVTWVAMAEILQSVQEKGKSSYDKPYFMSFLVHSAYAIFFVMWVIVQIVKKLVQIRRARSIRYSLVLNENEERNEAETLSPDNRRRDLKMNASSSDLNDWKQQLKQNWLITLIYSVLVYVVVYTWYLSLSRTYVSVNTAIYNSACVFVFIFSVALLKEQVSLLKAFSVLCCLGGVSMLCVDGLSSSDDKDNKNSIWGYVLVIISTIFYALYEVLFKRWGAYKEPASIISEDDLDRKGTFSESASDGEAQYLAGQRTTSHAHSDAEKETDIWKRLRVVEHTFLFVGLLGLWTIVLAWPGIIVVDKTGIEPFELPEGKALTGILITMLLDSLFNCLLILGIVLSTPLFISVGSLLTIPASVLSDFLLHGTVLPLLSYMGMLAIIVGFVCLTTSEYLHFRFRHQKKDREDRGRFAHLLPTLY